MKQAALSASVCRIAVARLSRVGAVLFVSVAMEAFRAEMECFLNI